MSGTSSSAAPIRPLALECLMRPSSVAIVGMSSKPGAPSRAVLSNLLRNGYAGDVHLVGKGGFEVDGIPCLGSIAELPDGVDLAVLVIGADAVKPTIEQLAAKGVRSAVCFASGFAETGDEGRRLQEEIAACAAEGGLAMVGPNCVGYFNYKDRLAIMLVELDEIAQVTPDMGSGVAVVAQSGGIGAHLAASLKARGVPVTYMMTTGNEAQVGLGDFVRFYLDDPQTSSILLYAEQVRDPQALVAAVEDARSRGKSVCIMHPGKSATAKAATASHTGALSGDHVAMKTVLENAGALVVDTLEQMIDLGELLVRCPLPPASGIGLVTASGALCAISQDYCDELGLTVPPLAAEQVTQLAEHLPAYTPPRNPLDLGTLAAWKPELLGLGVKAMLDDPQIGCILVSFPYGGAGLAVPWIEQLVAVNRGAAKPIVYAVHDEGVALPEEVERIALANHLVLSRSPERVLRAMAQLVRHAQARIAAAAARDGASASPLVLAGLPTAPGPIAEWRGKALLRSAGLPVPQGNLATDLASAWRIADEIGYPVVLKGQADALAHKSDAGAVRLGIKDRAGLEQAWTAMAADIARAAPGVALDGVLVEQMAATKGVELVIGARRDPQWGPLLLVGLGGVWIEALKDVQTLPAGASPDRIREALLSLRGRKLLEGFRGMPPVDLEAAVQAAGTIGRIMLGNPSISEIDVNPFLAFAEGQGGMALDALFVIEPPA